MLPTNSANGHRVCTSSPDKKLEFTMAFVSHIIAFITGVAVGFVFSVIILFHKRLDKAP
jgi:hypothetical protein